MYQLTVIDTETGRVGWFTESGDISDFPHFFNSSDSTYTAARIVRSVFKPNHGVKVKLEHILNTGEIEEVSF